MELLDENPKFDLFADEAPILSNSNIFPPEYIGPNAELINCMANNGCRILGKVQHSIVSLDCYVGEGAIVGAGSLVTKDIPAWTIAAGRPAKVLKEVPHREEKEVLGGADS